MGFLCDFVERLLGRNMKLPNLSAEMGFCLGGNGQYMRASDTSRSGFVTAMIHMRVNARGHHARLSPTHCIEKESATSKENQGWGKRKRKPKPGGTSRRGKKG